MTIRWWLPFLWTGVLACATPTPKATCRDQTPAQDHAFPKPAPISGTARAVLSNRMQRHGLAMSDMMWSVMFLDYESVEDIARQIASEPRLARPISQDASELNARLPPMFFDLQDALMKNAEAVMKVASYKDPAALSAAVARLTDTCIRCHTAYLKEPVSAAQTRLIRERSAPK